MFAIGMPGEKELARLTGEAAPRPNDGFRYLGARAS